MPVIRETILTTVGADGHLHITPIGIIADEDGWIIAPFRPSTTLDNLRAVPFAVANHTDDVRIFAGCLTGRHEWPTRASDNVPVPRLTAALAHAELAVIGITEDEQHLKEAARRLRLAKEVLRRDFPWLRFARHARLPRRARGSR